MELTTSQNKTWEKLYTFWINKGHTDNEADELAYRDLIETHPELDSTEGRNALKTKRSTTL